MLDSKVFGMYCDKLREYKAAGKNTQPIIEQIFADGEIYAQIRAYLLKGAFSSLFKAEMAEYGVSYNIKKALESNSTANLFTPLEISCHAFLITQLPNYYSDKTEFIGFLVTNLKQSVNRYISALNFKTKGSTHGDNNHITKINSIVSELLAQGYREEDITPELISERAAYLKSNKNSELSTNVIITLQTILDTKEAVSLDEGTVILPSRMSAEDEFFTSSSSDTDKLEDNECLKQVCRYLNEVEKYIIEALYVKCYTPEEIMYLPDFLTILKENGYEYKIKTDKKTGNKYVVKSDIQTIQQNALYKCDKKALAEWFGMDDLIVASEKKNVEQNDFDFSTMTLGSLVS